MPTKKVRRKVVFKKEIAPRRIAALATLATLRVGPHEPPRELVNHPAHYGGDTPHEVIKCLEAWGLEWDALLWNAVKYIARSTRKGSQASDLEKARFYLDRRINSLRSGAGLPQCPAKTKESIK
jgi:hypothetical protein